MIPEWTCVMWAAMARTESKRLRQLTLAAGVAGAAVFGFAGVPQIHAQSAPTNSAPSPSFEVASIKPNHSASGSTHISSSGNKFLATNVGIKHLIEFAYNIQRFQILAGPDWIDSERYDIDAKEEDSLAEEMHNLPSEESGSK